MKLSRLITALDTPLPGPEDPDIGSIHYRGQQVRPGGLFVAIKGLTADGHDYIGQAVENGAAAVVAQGPVEAPVPVVTVENSRLALAALAARFYGDPSRSLTVIGITGTNGKTTTAYLVEGILMAAGFRTGVIGTIDCRYAGTTRPSPMTTPESLDLHRILARMRDAGVTHVVMEISSHAVDLHRIHQCRIRLAVLTNLTQDHLDYHGTMDEYWACKKRLFTRYLDPPGEKIAAVINGDDPRGAELARELGRPLLRVGTGASGDLHPASFQCDLSGIRAELHSPQGRLAIRSALTGRHNLENILCAAGVGLALGLAPETLQDGIRSVTAVPGRLESVPDDGGRFVFVDYAHTPDALNHALAVLGDLAQGRLICVFGCGGDRDRTKRPLMGKIAGDRANLVIITSDNPRSEPPLSILADIEQGIEQTRSRCLSPDQMADPESWPGYIAEPDREKAIALAMTASCPGDAVLIAGKGHETYQIIGQTTRDFDDRVHARAALKRLKNSMENGT